MSEDVSFDPRVWLSVKLTWERRLEELLEVGMLPVTEDLVEELIRSPVIDPDITYEHSRATHRPLQTGNSPRGRPGERRRQG